jgi:hypothetical protein
MKVKGDGKRGKRNALDVSILDSIYSDQTSRHLSVDQGRTTADVLLDLIHAARPAWHADAACRGHMDVMFPSSNSSNDYEVARQLCETCPVRQPCAEAGRNEHHGTWGGHVKGRSPKGRAVNVYQFLAARGGWWTARAIAAELEVTPRSVNRQLAPLLDVGKVERRGRPGDNAPGSIRYRAVQK